jgi:hypothetical protein
MDPEEEFDSFNIYIDEATDLHSFLRNRQSKPKSEEREEINSLRILDRNEKKMLLIDLSF